MNTSMNKNNNISIIFIVIILFIPTTFIFSTPDIINLGEDLEIRKLTQDMYVVIHKFPWTGNSLLVLIGNDDLVFVDTPYTPEATDQVVDWILDILKIL